MNHRLYRCNHDRRIAGVASGLAQYLDIDPTVVRIAWVLSFFLGGIGLLLYIVMAIIVPVEPATDGMPPAPASSHAAASSADWHAGAQWSSARHADRGAGGGQLVTIAGVALILFGAIALANAFLPDWRDSGRFLWPAFVIGIGVLLVVNAVRRGPPEPIRPPEPTVPWTPTTPTTPTSPTTPTTPTTEATNL